MDINKQQELLSEYSHLQQYYKHIPQEQITEWVRKLISSQTKQISEFIVNFKCDGFFRGRVHNSLDGENGVDGLHPFKCDAEFWNPPSDLCKRRGRCNDINESLFYCSSELSTSVIELRPKKGDFITIAKFNLKFPEKYNGARMKYVGLKTLSKSPIFKDVIGKGYEKDIEELELDETLDDLFHQKVNQDTEDLYRLSIAVTKSMMRTLFDIEEGIHFEMHGMIYPSIEGAKKHFNMVYRPEHIKFHYAISQIVTYEVLKIDDKTIHIQEKKIGHLKPTRRLDPLDYYGIDWKNSQEEETLIIDL